MPVETFELSTREPDVAHAALTELYQPERTLRFSAVSPKFTCDVRSVTVGDVGRTGCGSRRR